ncbi:MAG TPA: DUF4127 family protein [Bacilli bacterium]|nr:MAG: hypothetical protein BWY97_01201 [Tenericutes bacterium ADurb.BinA124]HPX83683.1 DUF4127 family protein [Bacilli bacterium]
MTKIIYIPLDERPCNYRFPVQLFFQANTVVITPPMPIMGYKKRPADMDALKAWLIKNTGDADGLVVALDTLLYGGIVPSRLHHCSFEDLSQRLAILSELKTQNPRLIIYAFQLIMRCPQYNSADEEPEYFQTHGKDIHNYGYFHHQQELGMITKEDQAQLKALNIPKEYLSDFSKRRLINQRMNIAALEFVKKGIISFFIFPQDDSSKYGWTAKDQIKIRQAIKDQHLTDLVYMYPGADEAGCVLTSRLVCHLHQISPKVLIKYPGPSCPSIIPSIEDRYLDTMVKYHVLACGGIVVDSLRECDAVLFINAPADYMRSSFSREEPGRGLAVLRNMAEAMAFIDYAYHRQKAIIIADITYGNGSDLEIYQWLAAKNLLDKLAGFGGWNTASNSIGQAIAMGYSYLINGASSAHFQFLASRYVEDIGYCGYVRQFIMADYLPKHPPFNYFDVGETDGVVAAEVKRQLQLFVQEKMPDLWERVEISKVQLPWKRMYEVDLEVKIKKLPKICKPLQSPLD